MGNSNYKRVLVIATTFPRWQNDTTPAFVYELSKRLQNSGFKIFVLAPHHNGAEKFEIMDGMRIYRFPYFWPEKYQKLVYEGGILPNIKRSNLSKIQVPFLFLSELYYTFKLIKKERIDVIHTHWIIPNGLVGGLLSRIFKIMHITTAHAGDVFTIRKSKILSIFGSFVLKNSETITANSEYTKSVIVSIENRVKKNVKIIPMGVDTSRFNPDKASGLRNDFGAEYLILSIGRLVDKKGIKYLIMAMKDVIKVFSNAKLIIGGSGPDKDKLVKFCDDLDLKNNVIFMGYIDNTDLPKYYASSDIFVLPSIETKGGDTEGLGVVLLEAMACGIPVIGSNVGGITDIIVNGKNGFLTIPGNPQDLSDKIITILSNNVLHKNISQNGLKTVTKKFSWDLVTDEFVKCYGELK